MTKQLSARFRNLIGTSVMASAALFGAPAHAQLNFDFNFQGDFVGNAAAQQAVVTAGQQFSSMFATHFSNTATLTFDVNSETSGLAEAGTTALGLPGFGTGEVVRNKVLTGVDINGAANDGFIHINLATNFQLNPNAPVDFAGGQIDFYSVLDHELTHALGFLSLGTTTNDAALSKFDQFLTTNEGMPLYDPVTGVRNVAAFNEASNSTGLFAGANAIADFGAPVSIQGVDGDLSHLGTDAFSSPAVPQNALMLCCGGKNVSFEPRDYDSAEIGILTDLGYTPDIPAVPLPSSVLLMLTGIAGLGTIVRRKKA